jgi:hypothetical protein
MGFWRRSVNQGDALRWMNAWAFGPEVASPNGTSVHPAKRIALVTKDAHHPTPFHHRGPGAASGSPRPELAAFASFDMEHPLGTGTPFNPISPLPPDRMISPLPLETTECIRQSVLLTSTL